MPILAFRVDYPRALWNCAWPQRGGVEPTQGEFIRSIGLLEFHPSRRARYSGLG